MQFLFSSRLQAFGVRHLRNLSSGACLWCPQDQHGNLYFVYTAIGLLYNECTASNMYNTRSLYVIFNSTKTQVQMRIQNAVLCFGGRASSTAIAN